MTAMILGIKVRDKQGKGNVTLTNNYKGKFLYNPLPIFLPFLPSPLQLHEEKKQDIVPSYFHRFRDFCRIGC